jgi:hypothetical protein
MKIAIMFYHNPYANHGSDNSGRYIRRINDALGITRVLDNQTMIDRATKWISQGYKVLLLDRKLFDNVAVACVRANVSNARVEAVAIDAHNMQGVPYALQFATRLAMQWPRASVQTYGGESNEL